MGLDSPLPIAPDAPKSPSSGRKATTASMQNLLAHYFESHGDEPVIAGFDSVPPHGLTTPQTETRHPESRLASEAAVASSFARLEAAFVALKPPPAPEPVSKDQAVKDEVGMETPQESVLPEPEPEPEPLPQQPARPDDDIWPEAARHLAAALMRERDDLRAQVHRLQLELGAAQDQADNDVLTPTLNRRAFLREVHRAMADCKRYGEDACLIYLDMDSFKSINDTYGHAAGDRALVYVAETLKASVREGDAVGRIGGDEFAVLLRRADLTSARIKAMKLEAELMMGTFEHAGLHLKTGGSFGVRAFASQPSAEAWLSEADAAMFLVKKASR